MSRTTQTTTCLLIDLTDADGHATGKSVPVFIEYVVEVDSDYGADADGHRGEVRTEYSILDHYIETEDLLTMNSGEVERALADADATFHRLPHHH